MTSVAMLWLALISVFTPAPRTPDSTGSAAPAWSLTQAATQGTRSLAVAVESRAAEPALCAARVVVGLPIARTQTPSRHYASGSPCSPADRHAEYQTRHARMLRVLGAFSHAVASRGSVLPYFSTAPPLPA